MQSGGTREVINRKVTDAKTELQTDMLALEEPLELRIGVEESTSESISVLMRTPGDDRELALGFLVSEGLLDTQSGQVPEIRLADGSLTIIFSPEALPDIESLRRNFYASSSCGICGKGSIEAVMNIIPPKSIVPEFKLRSQKIIEICNEMRASQNLFDSTGAVHAAGFFDAEGGLMLVREDVGRHNALDKVIGAALESQLLDGTAAGVCVSGRAGFELMQKAAMAGVKFLISVGAPTSLSVDFATANSMTLVGFISSEGYNIYTGDWRIS